MAQLKKVRGINELEEQDQQSYTPSTNPNQQAAVSILTGQSDAPKGQLAEIGEINEFEEPADPPKFTAPAPYQSNYQSQIDSLLNSILNRENFTYDMNADPLYQQYKDQYVAGGRAAMMDTMGQAAALTGGYGNSYASTAGNMAYQNYLTGLNSAALDLYDAAYSRYQDQGNQMLNNLGMLMSADEAAYNRYLDDRNFQYQQYLDALSQGNWQTEFEHQQQQDQQAQENWQMEYDYTTRKWKKKNKNKNSSGGSKKNNSSSGNSNTNTSVTTPTFNWNQWVGIR